MASITFNLVKTALKKSILNTNEVYNGKLGLEGRAEAEEEQQEEHNHSEETRQD